MKLLMTASVWEHIKHFHLPYLFRFRQLGWKIHVGCAGIPEQYPLIDNTINLPFEKDILSVANFHAMQLLKKNILAEKYDLIITHTTLAAFFTRLAIKDLKNRPPLVDVMHGYLFDETSSIITKTIYRTAEKIVAPQTDLLLTMNQWDFEFAQRNHLGKRIELIPGMGVDFSKLDKTSKQNGEDLRISLGIPQSATVLIYVAEFSPRKRQHVLIEAMKSLPQDVILVLCGRGETLRSCWEYAKKIGVENRVKFPGYVKNIEIWYSMANISVTPSRIEGLPFNVMEAMYMGLPVIASKIKGHTDLIRDGINGCLFDNDLPGKVVQLIENPALCSQLGIQAKESVKEYDLEVVLPLVMEKYLSLVCLVNK